jgi:hypothetical protein
MLLNSVFSTVSVLAVISDVFLLFDVLLIYRQPSGLAALVVLSSLPSSLERRLPEKMASLMLLKL